MRRKELLHLPVADDLSTKILGTVTELDLAPDLRLRGLHLRCRGLRRGSAYAPLSRVRYIGNHLVLLRGAPGSSRACVPLEGLPLQDPEGNLLGRAVDLDFDLPSGRLRAVLWRRYLRGSTETWPEDTLPALSLRQEGILLFSLPEDPNS